MWCDVLCCVMSRNALRCQVMSSHVMSCHLLWSDAVQWDSRSYEFVMRCHVVWFEVVVWGELEDDLVIRTTQIYSVLHSTTKYYSSTTLYYTVLLQYYSVLQSTTPVLVLYYKVLLLCTTKYNSSTTLYYKVLPQYYSVLQSTTPVLLCTTKYYSSTSLYYKVLLQLLCTTPVLLRTTKYYSSTRLHYKVLLQYYSVLQSTTPVLLCTTKYYSSTTPYSSSTTPYYKILLQYYSVLQSTTPVLLCTTKYDSSTTLYYKVLLFARRGAPTSPNAMAATKSDTPRSPNTAPATQNDSHDWCPSHMKRHLQCAEQQASPSNLTKYCACHAKWLSWLMSVTHDTSFTMRGATCVIVQTHQILRLPRKMTLMIDLRHIWNVISNARNKRHHPPTSPNTTPATQNCIPKSKKNLPIEASIPMRGRFDHDPTMLRPWTRHLAPARSPRLLFALRRRILYWKLQHFALRLSTQISPNTAPATRSDTPRSPNTAPATKNDSHDWYPWHMKRHLQCAEQQASPSNLTKYCPCHEKWCASLIVVTYETSFTMRGATGITLQPHQTLRLHATQNDIPKSKRNSLKTVEVAFAMRGRSENDPNPIRPWTRHLAPARSPRLLFALRRRILYWKLQHFALRLSTQISPNAAPATKSDTPRSANTAPATKNDSWLISVTYETSFTMRGATSITLQPHQILRLPRKKSLVFDPRHIWNVIYNARSNKHHPPTSPNAAPATKNDAHHWLSSHMKRHLQCAEQQASPSNLTKYCACHAKLHSKIKEKFAENSWSVNSNAGTIRYELVISHPPVRRGYFSRFGGAFCIENYNISRFGDLPNRILRLPQKVTLQDPQMLRQPQKMTLQDHQILRLSQKVTLQVHQILRLPRKVRLLLNCYWTELLLSCYGAVTELLLNWPVTELLLDCHWTVTELTCYWAVTELLLDWYWTVTELTCYWAVTELLLNWAVTELNCYWTVTELTCYWTVTELLLNWPVTELLLLWAVIAFLSLRNSEVSQLYKFPLIKI